MTLLILASLASSPRNFHGPLIEALRDAGPKVHPAANRTLYGSLTPVLSCLVAATSLLGFERPIIRHFSSRLRAAGG